MLKPSVFHIFHLWKAFREYHFCTAWANSKWRKLYFVQAKRSSFYHAWKKSLEMPVDPKNPMPKRLRSIFSQLCHKHLGIPKWNSTGSFAPTPNDFLWFLHGICLFGQKGLASICSSVFLLGMCKHNIIFYQHNIKLMFAHVDNMCKRSNTFYERNIKLVFAHVNSMCKSSSICFSMVACHRTLLFHPTPLHL